MAKTKISEFDSNPANNTDIDSINIAEGCAPSGINNAIRELMSQLKDQQTGASGDGFTVAGTLTSSGTLAVTGGLTLDGSAGTSGQVLLSAGSGNTPTWGASFVAGMIMMWSGSVATIPTGWVICDGANSTPDLRNRFVIGAGSTYAVAATGGNADAIVVSHTHALTGTTASAGTHRHFAVTDGVYGNEGGLNAGNYIGRRSAWNSDFSYDFGIASGEANIGLTSNAGEHEHSLSGTTASTGSSATNANLPPYYALAYIMKS